MECKRVEILLGLVKPVYLVPHTTNTENTFIYKHFILVYKLDYTTQIMPNNVINLSIISLILTLIVPRVGKFARRSIFWSVTFFHRFFCTVFTAFYFLNWRAINVSSQGPKIAN